MNAFARYLDRKSITSRTLGKRIGYSLAAVRSWRQGARSPSPGAAALIAKALGITTRRVLRMIARKENPDG